MLQEVDSSQIFTDDQPDNRMEVSLQEFDELVEDKRALDRLYESPDFHRVILNKYITEEASRLNGFLMSRNVQAVKDRDLIVSKIVAKGFLSHFLKDMTDTLQGIENPAQRVELIKQLQEQLEEGASDE